jgi:hypothetical protein
MTQYKKDPFSVQRHIRRHLNEVHWLRYARKDRPKIASTSLVNGKLQLLGTPHSWHSNSGY